LGLHRDFLSLLYHYRKPRPAELSAPGFHWKQPPRKEHTRLPPWHQARKPKPSEARQSLDRQALFYRLVPERGETPRSSRQTKTIVCFHDNGFSCPRWT